MPMMRAAAKTTASKLHTHAKKAAGLVLRHAKDHFIPHEGNGHVPHVLRPHVLLGYGVFAVLLKATLVLVPIMLPYSSAYSSSLTPGNVIALTNESRASLDLPDLKTNAMLDAAAKAKAEDMLANGYFAHTSPTGLTGFSFIKKTGYHYQFAGENLAVHYDSAEGVTAGWMASPTHKANIVNTRFKDIGVGVAQGDFNGYPSTLVVQMFGEPVTVAPVIKLASPSIQPVTEEVQKADTTTSTAAVSVGDTAKDVFAFAAPVQPQAKVLGMTMDDLDDSARRFYLYAVLFLIGATALATVIKFHFKRLPIIAHSMALIVLGIGLMSM